MLELIIAALATWEALEIWHHSRIMARGRAWTETWDGLLGELVRCPFCLAPYTALACLIGLDLHGLPGWYGMAGRGLGYLVYALAAARLANLCNDAFHGVCRTVRHNRLLPSTPDDEVPS